MSDPAPCGHAPCPDDEGRCFRERFIKVMTDAGMTREEAVDVMARVGRRLAS